MDSYAGMSDEELIRMLRSGKGELMDYIMDKYKFLVRKRANAMFLIGGENEDLIQEGMIGLFKAVRDFKEDRESSFAHFADLCVSRQIFNAVEASRRKKHQPLNSYVSLNAEDEESGAMFLDMLMSLDAADPEQLVIDRENAAAMGEKIDRTFSKMEKTVLSYYLKGMNYVEIAKVMDKKPKAIDNALQRIRGKLNSKE